MPANLNHSELVGLMNERVNQVRRNMGKLDEVGVSEAEVLGVAQRFKRLRDVMIIIKEKLNTALESQEITIDDL